MDTKQTTHLWRLNVVTEHNIRTEDVLAKINEVGDELALVLIGGELLYGSGFDMKTITAAGHEAGAVVGWDLAHAAGNIKWNYRLGC
jgi:kynureninase